MNSDIRRRWVAALRDPESVQGRDALGTTSGKRCCLGVLCDLAVQDGVIKPPITKPGLSTVLHYDGNYTMPSDTVRRWAELDANFAERLANLNDKGHTFAQIAEVIEAGDDDAEH